MIHTVTSFSPVPLGQMKEGGASMTSFSQTVGSSVGKLYQSLQARMAHALWTSPIVGKTNRAFSDEGRLSKGALSWGGALTSGAVINAAIPSVAMARDLSVGPDKGSFVTRGFLSGAETLGEWMNEVLALGCASLTLGAVAFGSGSLAWMAFRRHQRSKGYFKDGFELQRAGTLTPGDIVVGTKGRKRTRRYCLHKVLGVGGGGEVFLGEDLETGKQVAIKKLRGELSDSLNANVNFGAEVALLYKFRNSKYIVGLVDQQNSPFPFAAIEYMPGGDLDALVEKAISDNQVPSLESVIPILLDSLLGLRDMNLKNYTHLDIKPQNILLYSLEGVVRAKLADLGLARASDAKMTRLQGSPRYMSPEQILGTEKKIGIQSDIFSWGISMYEWLAMYHPFGVSPGDGIDQARNKILESGALTPIGDYRPDLPEWLQSVIMKCLERDISDRYQSPQDIFIDIISQLASEGYEDLVELYLEDIEKTQWHAGQDVAEGLRQISAQLGGKSTVNFLDDGE